MKKLLNTCILIFLFSGIFASDIKIKTTENSGGKGLAITLNGQMLFETPKEGLWSVATDWNNKWPANWKHAHATSIEKTGDWTVLNGTIELPEGKLILQDAYRVVNNKVQGKRRYRWESDKTLNKTTLSVRFQCPGSGKGIFMPGILYYGNPSGAKSGFTPVWNGQQGELAMFEEHRFPMPFVSMEWKSGSNQKYYGAAMHSLPSPVPYANYQDQWWSLGASAGENYTELMLLSGPCASNGLKSVIKAYQGKHNQLWENYDEAYINIQPGAIIEKIFWLEVYPVESQGKGFQHAVHTSIDIFKPVADPTMPTLNEILQSKHAFAQTRWLEGDGYAGYNQFDESKEYIVFGWVGQAAAPAYAMQILKEELQYDATKERVQSSLDLLSTTEFYDLGFRTWYHVKDKKWGDRIWKPMPEILSQGQGMFNMANATRLGRQQGYNTSKWEDFLKKASDFHSERILDENWNPKSTNEGFFMAPLCKAYQLFNNEQYKKAAIKAGEVYKKRHYTMEEPYWGGTLDASCEDKEGAFAALQGFLALYELTGEQQYLELAKHAGDVCLSYVVVWDIDMPAGRLRDHNFKSRGWTAVSVQNMHIDVYGVLIAPDIYRLGQIAKDKQMQDLALLMVRSCGQLMDPWGSQGEQPQQTNYTQGHFTDWKQFRGNYVEDWTVFWITAHFLNATAQLKELGVNID